MKFKSLKGQDGFSLVELMVVVGIIGILTSLAVPRFQNFQAKAKMSEARSTLGTVRTLEESYFSENNVYLAATAYGGPAGGSCTKPAGFINLGFELKDCASTRFYYLVDSITTTGFTARAQTGTTNAVCNSTTSLEINITESRGFVLNPLSGCG